MSSETRSLDTVLDAGSCTDRQASSLVSPGAPSGQRERRGLPAPDQALASDATLGSLPLHNVRVSPQTEGRFVRELFEQDGDLPGILVMEGGSLYGVISRALLLRQLARPFGLEVFAHRPTRLILDAVHLQPLRLPETLSIHAAVEIALHRPPEARHEPLVVELSNGDVRLLNETVLVLAQSHLLELANERILQQKEAAEASSISKGQFLANMSHEIRTPMNGILGLTDLLLETELTEEQREYLQMVRSSADWLLTVINDILDFSKIEAGKLNLERISFALRETVGDLMKPLALRARAKDLELHCHIRPDVPDLVHGDPTRLRQVLVNLVGNAIKFTTAGEILVRITIERREVTGVWLRCEVADTGMGIAADKLDAVFRAFEQADGSTSRKFGGTGLGLSICSRLVELMEGRIWVESELGHGSRFYFTSRFEAVADPRANEPRLPRELVGKRVLVVDDRPLAREALSETLRAWGLQVATAESGEQAQELLLQSQEPASQFELAVVDEEMPGWGGPELCRWIRATRSLSGVGVILLMTGRRPDDNSQDRLEAVRVFKPVKHSELLHAVLAILGGETRAAVAPQSPQLPSRRLRILLAEDSLVNQKLALRLLEKQHHAVTLVENGRAALEALEDQLFDVVLMDVQMPIMDGFQATEQIRLRETTSGTHLPIIAMTAHALKGDRERCLAAGMDGYVSKPIAAERLYRALEEVLAARAGPGGSTAPLDPADPGSGQSAGPTLLIRETACPTASDEAGRSRFPLPVAPHC